MLIKNDKSKRNYIITYTPVVIRFLYISITYLFSVTKKPHLELLQQSVFPHAIQAQGKRQRHDH